MFAQNYSADKIFEGPWLSGGFIKDEDLLATDLKSEIHLSDIMSQIMQVDAVSNILSLLFNPKGLLDELPNKWIIEVSEGKQPLIDIIGSNVLFYIDGNPFRPNMNKVKVRFDSLMSDLITGNDLVVAEDISYDTGNFQNIENYYSIQNHYPKNYGISYWGLPRDVGDERLAQAKQLQGYLYFFDQILAITSPNYLISGIYFRFSLRPKHISRNWSLVLKTLQICLLPLQISETIFRKQLNSHNLIISFNAETSSSITCSPGSQNHSATM